MSVAVVRDPARATVDIYVGSPDGGHSLVYRDGSIEYVEQLPGAVRPVFISIQERLWEDILREAMRTGGVPHPDALADAQKVRDRLLAMVESEWQSRQMERST